jgi:hypothetical protein
VTPKDRLRRAPRATSRRDLFGPSADRKKSLRPAACARSPDYSSPEEALGFTRAKARWRTCLPHMLSTGLQGTLGVGAPRILAPRGTECPSTPFGPSPRTLFIFLLLLLFCYRSCDCVITARPLYILNARPGKQRRVETIKKIGFISRRKTISSQRGSIFIADAISHVRAKG